MKSGKGPFFVPVPPRFFDALVAGDIGTGHFIVGLLVAWRCFEVKNTAAGVATLRLASLADLCNVSDDTIQRKLEDLEAGGWVDLERPKPGQRTGWRIRLKGLAYDEEVDATTAPPPHHLRTTSAKDPPPVRRSSSAEMRADEAATPHEKRERTSAQPPQTQDAKPTDETRRDDKKRDKSNPLSHGEQDHVVGETTTADLDDTTNRMLAAITGIDGPRVRVEQTPDGSLVWHGAPHEGEEGCLEDFQALVDAGLARWESE